MGLSLVQCQLIMALAYCKRGADHAPARPMLYAMTGADVDDKDDEGTTPLHQAAVNGRALVCELLLDRGMSWYWCGAAPAWPKWRG
jgi:hypothetical protein